LGFSEREARRGRNDQILVRGTSGIARQKDLIEGIQNEWPHERDDQNQIEEDDCGALSEESKTWVGAGRRVATRSAGF